MRQDFFDTYEPQEKAVPRSLSLTEAEWRLIDAYRLFGTSKKAREIPLQWILKQAVLSHVRHHRAFFKERDKWLAKLAEIETAAATAEGTAE